MRLRLWFRLLASAFVFVVFFSACQSHKPTYRIPSNHQIKTYKKRPNYTKVAPVEKNESSLRSDIISEAHKYIGTTYHYGGKTPSPGFDCSGFLTYVFSKKGVPIQGSSKTLAKLGKKKSKTTTESGDLAFFGNNGKVTHVALVIANQNGQIKVIHSTSKGGVRVDDVFSSQYWKSKYLFSRSIIEE